MRLPGLVLAMLALMSLGCTIGPRPGNWEAPHRVPDLQTVRQLMPGPHGMTVGVGVTPDGHVAAAVFDEGRGSWHPPVESPLTPDHWDIVPLPGGDVLITSDESANWRFQPSDGSWTPVARMSVSRFGYASSPLRDGRVLACGGEGPSHLSIAGCELYSPAIDHWSSAAAMSTPRFGPVSITLSDGRVFVTGGAFNPSPDLSVALDPLDTSEIYDPRSNAFSAAPGFLDPVTDPVLVNLDDGGLLAIGGRQGFRRQTSTTQALDLRNGRWTLKETPTAFGKATPLADGRILSLGRTPASGVANRSGAIYDPSADLWTALTPPPANFVVWDVARLSDGRLLAVTLGHDPDPQWALYDPNAFPPLPGRDGPLASKAAVSYLGGLVALLLLLVTIRSWRRAR